MEEYRPNQNQDSSKGMGEHEGAFRYPKPVIAGVALLSILSLVLVFWQMQNHFTIEMPQLVASNGGQTERISLLEQEEAQLKNQDSDLDGLTDYQELKVYGSSPFVADSDSDGIPDAVEVKNQTDPNCPTGQNCFGSDSSLQTGTNIGSPLSEDQVQLEAIANDPSLIRQLLIEGGVDPAIVAQADDQSLQIIAQQTLTTLNDPTDELQALLDSLTVENVRGFFQTLQVPEEDIADFTNEQLLEIVRGTVAEQLSGESFETLGQ